MKIKFSKSAVKFLEKQNEKTKERIRLKLKDLTQEGEQKRLIR